MPTTVQGEGSPLSRRIADSRQRHFLDAVGGQGSEFLGDFSWMFETPDLGNMDSERPTEQMLDEE
jgi:hypothetical protein